MRRTRKINWHRRPIPHAQPTIAGDLTAACATRTNDPLSPDEKFAAFDEVVRQARAINLRRKMKRPRVPGIFAAVPAPYSLRPAAPSIPLFPLFPPLPPLPPLPPIPPIPPLPSDEKFVSPREVARIVNVSVPAVMDWIRRRQLAATKALNGHWKIKPVDFENFIRARQDLGRKKIMFIDAPGPDATEMAQAIEQIGQTAVFVYQREDAFLRATSLHPSLFVANVSLKAFDVWALLKRIRNTGHIRNAPLLLIADRELQEAKRAWALELGAHAFLTRPFKRHTLIEEIKLIQRRMR